MTEYVYATALRTDKSELWDFYPDHVEDWFATPEQAKGSLDALDMEDWTTGDATDDLVLVRRMKPTPPGPVEYVETIAVSTSTEEP